MTFGAAVPAGGLIGGVVHAFAPTRYATTGAAPLKERFTLGDGVIAGDAPTKYIREVDAVNDARRTRSGGATAIKVPLSDDDSYMASGMMQNAQDPANIAVNRYLTVTYGLTPSNKTALAVSDASAGESPYADASTHGESYWTGGGVPAQCAVQLSHRTVSSVRVDGVACVDDRGVAVKVPNKRQ